MKQGQQEGMTRRDFARMSATAGFAIAAGRAFSADINSDTLKVGLIGCGGRGTGAAVNMFEGDNNVVLTAMADVFEDKVKGSLNSIKNHDNPKVSGACAVDEDHCFAGLDAYKQLIATDVDIVIHGALPYCRPQHVEAAIDAGKHVFTEKPVAVDPDGIRRFIAASQKAKKKKLSLVAGTQRRHQKEYIETIKRIHDGDIGEVLAMRAYWCGGLPFARERKPEWSDLENCIRNWYGFCWMAGDNIVEQHVHNIDVCNWVMGGPPKSVFLASGGRTWKPDDPKYGDIYDHFSCDFEYEGGAHMSSFSRHWHHSADGVFEDIVGTKGRSNGKRIGKWRAERGINPYVQEHIDLVKSVRGEGPYYNEGERVAASTMTAIMGRMAAYTGQRYTYKKALEISLNLVPEDLSFDKEYPLGPVPSPGA
ncbi:MAG: Gfo/Idh/MocA family oxidoreductase [Nitrospiraceae bacterium]|nr:Gfo/Idh/MocA family oxidoreductase [Nitrospiraceae bacterium]